ncbi:hypothetical protein [Dysgonomonas sp. GY617]|uniref:hypothetical protein n=1 Tax=Dysgonomonas sp. GY617 TaxID=2780420 RepID=UPI001883DFC0|nr:hypothetical protein [Dysgonomonas sp. GY617]MBF0577291.1 hypothetical protein [Dysgonomonas sp. GY617]
MLVNFDALPFGIACFMVGVFFIVFIIFASISCSYYFKGDDIKTKIHLKRAGWCLLLVCISIALVPLGAMYLDWAGRH